MFLAHAQQIAVELNDELSKDENFLGLYLYGSQVKNTAHADSDLDICGVFNRDIYNPKISRIILDFDVKYEVVIDFQRFTLSDLETDHHYYTEVKKGIHYARQRSG
ncbi:MAG: nucleotidyltransferase domain-containing protein [Thermoguttaceae bacterium]